MKQLKALPTKVKWILAGGVAFWLVVFAAIPSEPIETEEAWQNPSTSVVTTTNASNPTTKVESTSTTTVTMLTTTTLNPTPTTTTPSTTTSTTTVPEPSLDEVEKLAAELVFVAVVQDDYPTADPDGLLEVGYEMCAQMVTFKEAGQSIDDYIIFLLLEADGDQDVVDLYATVAGAAAGSLCNDMLPWALNEGVASEQICGDREAEPCASDCSSTCQGYIVDA